MCLSETDLFFSWLSLLVYFSAFFLLPPLTFVLDTAKVSISLNY
jgi:hypothetical protein